MPESGLSSMTFQIGDTAFFSAADEVVPGYGRVVQKQWNGRSWVELKPEFMDEYIPIRPLVAHFSGPESDAVKWAGWFSYVVLPQHENA
jgi:hypothetical protein